MTRSSELDRAVEKLTQREKGWEEFKPAPTVGARPGSKTTGRPSGTQSTGSTLAFVESSYAAREYYAERTLTTTDGLFSIAWRPTKKLIGDNGGVIELKEPPA